MSDQKLYENIDAYLNGELSGQELSEFEVRIQTDQELADQVAIFRDIDYAIKDKPVLDFQKMVANEGKSFLQKEEEIIEEIEEKKTVVKKFNWRRTILVAASIVVLASALFVWQSQLNTPSTGQDLFAQHYSPYDLNESVRGTSNNVSDFDQAIQKYQNREFIAAAEILKNLSNDNPNDMVTAFSLANAHINQNPKNFAAAKVEFEKVIQEGSSIYVPSSKWYLALILLEQNKRTEATKLLLEIEDTGGSLGSQANQLIDQIKD